MAHTLANQMRFWKYEYPSGRELEPASYEFVADWFAKPKPFVEEQVSGFTRKVMLKEKDDAK